MKKLLCLLLFASQSLIAQRNVAFLHTAVANDPADALEAAVDFSEIPFEIAGGMFVVRASVDGKSGNFVLDTGAPGIVLNSEDLASKNSCKAASVSGAMTVGEVEVKNFQLGGIIKKRAQGHALNVQHLEAACGMDIMGLIGYDVLRNYELLFDFPNKKIQAYKTGKARKDQMTKPLLSLPFTLCGHVPVIVARVGNKRVFLGLDSGAEVNLLDKKFYDAFSPGELLNSKSELLTGIDNATQEVMAADVPDTKIKGAVLPNMRYVFTDLSRLRQDFDAPLDGLLGVPFFRDKVISIDYGRKRIYLW